jgi:xylose isomerase
MLNLEELIKNHIEAIEKMKLELKTAREMFEDSFNNNPTYREHLDKVKDVQKAKNSVRAEIAKQPSVATLEQKVKDIRFDISEQSKTLSDLLQDYKDQTGATSIEMRNGKILEIISTSRLVPSKGSK